MTYILMQITQLGRELEYRKLLRPVRELQGTENKQDIKLHQTGAEIGDEKLHQAGGEFPVAFGLVPWRHHVEIITKCKSIDEALFYISKTSIKPLTINQ